MGKFIDITGLKFGKLTVIERAENKNKKTMWLCECECGNKKIVNGHDLKDGRIKSCGCYNRQHTIDLNTTHGQSNTRLYNIWSAMKQRCYYKNSNRYDLYGGRGIYVCDEWLVFENFYRWAMENGYNDKLSIDRIDYNGNYEPKNCRWADPKTQGNNTSRNRYIEIDGQVKTLSMWCDYYKMDYQVASTRIRKLKWSPEKALTTPIKHKNKKMVS